MTILHGSTKSLFTMPITSQPQLFCFSEVFFIHFNQTQPFYFSQNDFWSILGKIWGIEHYHVHSAPNWHWAPMAFPVNGKITQKNQRKHPRLNCQLWKKTKKEPNAKLPMVKKIQRKSQRQNRQWFKKTKEEPKAKLPIVKKNKGRAKG